eukprot:g12494.t1
MWDANLGGLYLLCLGCGRNGGTAYADVGALPCDTVTPGQDGGKTRSSPSKRPASDRSALSCCALLGVGLGSLLCTSYVNFKSSAAFRQVIDQISTSQHSVSPLTSSGDSLSRTSSNSGNGVVPGCVQKWGAFFVVGSISSFLRTYCLQEVRILFETRLRASVFADLLRRPPHARAAEQRLSLRDVSAEVASPSARSQRKGEDQNRMEGVSAKIKADQDGDTVVYQLQLLYDDVDTLVDCFTSKAANALRYTSSLVGGTCVAFYNCCTLASWGFPLFFAAGYALARRNKTPSSVSAPQPKETQQRQKTGVADGQKQQIASGVPTNTTTTSNSTSSKVLQETELKEHAFARIQGAAVVRCFGQTETEARAFAALLEAFGDSERARGKRQAKLMGMIDLLMKLGLLGLSAGGALLVKRAKITSGQLVQFLLSTSMAALGFYGLLGIGDDFRRAGQAAARLAFVLEGGGGKRGDGAVGTIGALELGDEYKATNEGAGKAENGIPLPADIAVHIISADSTSLDELSASPTPRAAGFEAESASGSGGAHHKHRILAIAKSPPEGDLSAGGGTAPAPPLMELLNINAEIDPGVWLFRAPVKLELKRGEVLGLCGRSGAGKSSLIDFILGERRPTTGTVVFPAVNGALPQLRYMPQNSALIGDTVRKNVTFSALPDSLDATSSSTVVKRALELSTSDRFVCEAAAEDPPSANRLPTRTLESSVRGLSGGEQQRLSLARAVYGMENRPALYILDEVTSQLDAPTEKLVAERLFKSAFANPMVAMVVVSHSDEVLRRCTRFLVLGDGGIPQLVNSYAEASKLLQHA